MPTRRITGTKQDETDTNRQRSARTPEARENQLIAAAYDLAEKQIRNGTASSQVITQFLKLGSSREKLEQERLRGEVSLNKTKIELMESQKRVEELYGSALAAMKSYSGNSDPDMGVEDER